MHGKRCDHRRCTWTAGALILGLCSACPRTDAPSKDAGAAEAKAPHLAPGPARVETSNPACFSPWTTEGAVEEIVAGDRRFRRQGAVLTETTSDADPREVIGVLANVKEDTPENLENLGTILGVFAQRGAQSIVVAGDVGETKPQMVNVLRAIAAKGLPTFVVMGNREGTADFNAAVAEVQEQFTNVFHLGQLRLVSLDDVALVSVPGYHDKAYIHAEDGCHYLPADLEAVRPAVLAAAPKTVVLVSHGPPRQQGTDALDRTLEQDNAGDPALARFAREMGIKFGIFPNIQEAGGRATDIEGTKLLSQGEMLPELYLNPGAIDAVSWLMNDQTRSTGMGAVLTIEGNRAAFFVHRIER